MKPTTHYWFIAWHQTSNICLQRHPDIGIQGSPLKRNMRKGCRLLCWICVWKVTQHYKWDHTAICASTLIRAFWWGSKSSPATHHTPLSLVTASLLVHSGLLFKSTSQCFASLMELSSRQQQEVVCKMCYEILVLIVSSGTEDKLHWTFSFFLFFFLLCKIIKSYFGWICPPSWFNHHRLQSTDMFTFITSGN